MRLADINPPTVAASVVRTVLEHLHTTVMRLDHTIQIGSVLGPDVGALGLRATTEALAHYAQRGLPVWDWTHHGHAADALLDVIAALYSRAADGDLDRTAIDVLDDVDPDDAIGLVLVAAAARVKLDRENALSARELAALAGLSASQVRHLIRTGELVPEGGPREGRGRGPAGGQRVPAEEARRWLRARGVPGIEERRPPGRAPLSTPDEPAGSEGEG